MSTLYIFTASFPFGQKSETFLETEIIYLSKAFDQVYIIPAHKDSNDIRKLPVNCKTLDWIYKGPKHSGKKLFFVHFFKILKLFGSMIMSNSINRKMYLKYFRFYLSKLLGELDYYERLKPHFSGVDNKKSIFYTYWFEHSLLALCLLKGKGEIQHIYSRAHGFDLYDDRNNYKPIPFREYKLKNLSSVFCISAHGQNYLKSKVSAEYHSKIKLSYLGVRDPELINLNISGNSPVMVSVSSLVKFKRVDLIVDALNSYQEPIKWIHFGDGPDRDRIEQKINTLPSNVQVELKGHVSNQEILNYLLKNSVDLFISTSESEGLPVSMMEVQSYGIPILACNTGGIPEIVIPGKTGFLMPQNVTSNEVTKWIDKALKYKFQTNEILSFFSDNFDAEKNYTSFSEELRNLSNDSLKRSE